MIDLTGNDLVKQFNSRKFKMLSVENESREALEKQQQAWEAEGWHTMTFKPTETGWQLAVIKPGRLMSWKFQSSKPKTQ